MIKSKYNLFAAFGVILITLSGCGGQKFTIDDGRKVDEKLLGQIRALGAGEQSMRPAMLRSAALNESGCDNQWELPIAVATSYDLKEDDRVAWVRGLQVDERLTVIGAVPYIGINPGDKIVEIDGYRRENSQSMLEKLIDKRDSGESFIVKTLEGKGAIINPVKVCRGHFVSADPADPSFQDYHWLQSIHPLEVFNSPLTPDEALWMILWTQGLSEEGGARMKTFHYGLGTIKTIFTIASIANGVGVVANAARTASAAGASAATSAATSAVTQAAITELANEAKSRASKEIAGVIYDQVKKESVNALLASAANRAGLSGIAWVAGTTFDFADKWAFEGMIKLKANPMAAFTLHTKLQTTGAVKNAFVFDKERLAQMEDLAAKAGLSDSASRVLKGETEESIALSFNPQGSEGVSLYAITPTPEIIEAKEIKEDSKLPANVLMVDTCAPHDC